MYDYHPLVPAIIFFYFTKKIKDFRRKQATYTMVSTINSEEGCNLFVNLRKTVCTVVLPREGTPLYKLYRYVPPHRVGFLRRFGLKTGIHFAHFGLESGMVFEGTTGVYERIYRFNSK